MKAKTQVKVPSDDWRKHLGVLASQIRSVESALVSYDEDPISATAPSECFGLVAKSVDKEIDRILKAWGVSVDQFCDEVDRRVSGRCSLRLFVSF